MRSVSQVIANANGHITAEDAFYLHATHGFYINELAALCEAKGWSLDKDGFYGILESERERTRELIKPS